MNRFLPIAISTVLPGSVHVFRGRTRRGIILACLYIALSYLVSYAALQMIPFPTYFTVRNTGWFLLSLGVGLDAAYKTEPEPPGPRRWRWAAAIAFTLVYLTAMLVGPRILLLLLS